MAWGLADFQPAGKEVETSARAFQGRAQMDTWLEDRAWKEQGNTMEVLNEEASWT